MDRIGIIIVAGGSGLRMGGGLTGNVCGGIPKQFMLLAGRPVLVRTVERLAASLPGADIVVALPQDSIELWKRLSAEYGIGGSHRVCCGGSTRFHSVSRALAALGDCDYIAVHDGVRPLVSHELIMRTMDAARASGAAIPAVEPADSFRIMDAGTGEVSGADAGNDSCVGGELSRTLDRSLLRAVQTPQVFRARLLREAYAAAGETTGGDTDRGETNGGETTGGETAAGEKFTDDAAVVEAFGGRISLVQGEMTNIKITRPLDMALAEYILNQLGENEI